MQKEFYKTQHDLYENQNQKQVEQSGMEKSNKKFIKTDTYNLRFTRDGRLKNSSNSPITQVVVQSKSLNLFKHLNVL